jgi:hypothetical protein
MAAAVRPVMHSKHCVGLQMYSMLFGKQQQREGRP